MDKKSTDSFDKLRVVHVCERCGAAVGYSQVSEDVVVTGIVVCEYCGYAGPLRVKIKGPTDDLPE